MPFQIYLGPKLYALEYPMLAQMVGNKASLFMAGVCKLVQLLGIKKSCGSALWPREAGATVVLAMVPLFSRMVGRT